jgi:hypothetical protein
MVNITSLAAAAGFMLIDFQRNVLDISFANSGLENNPVISNPTNFPPTGNQMVSIQAGRGLGVSLMRADSGVWCHR